MHVTIIRADNAVGIDGEFLTIDCSLLHADFHALQWDGPESGGGGEGEIERNGNPKPPNEVIVDLGGYYVYVEAWREEKERQAAALAVSAAAAPPVVEQQGPTVVAD